MRMISTLAGATSLAALALTLPALAQTPSYPLKRGATPKAYAKDMRACSAVTAGAPRLMTVAGDLPGFHIHQLDYACLAKKGYRQTAMDAEKAAMFEALQKPGARETFMLFIGTGGSVKQFRTLYM